MILTDGDVVFQPRKIERSGLLEAVDGNVLVYVHKELEIEDVERRYPAERYVFVDDKLRLLTAFKEVWGDRVTTVFPRQGHYARDPDILRALSRRRHDGGSNRRARRRGFLGGVAAELRKPARVVSEGPGLAGGSAARFQPGSLPVSAVSSSAPFACGPRCPDQWSCRRAPAQPLALKVREGYDSRLRDDQSDSENQSGNGVGDGEEHRF